MRRWADHRDFDIQLALYDIVNTPGVAADLSHIATPAKVNGYLPSTDPGMEKTLKGADIVVIPAGVPRKPGVSFDIVPAPACQDKSTDFRHLMCR